MRDVRLGVRWPVRLLVLASGRRSLLGLVQPAAFAAGTPPQSPGLNHQTNASNLITLTWDPTPAATSYRLNRRTSSGDEGPRQSRRPPAHRSASGHFYPTI